MRPGRRIAITSRAAAASGRAQTTGKRAMAIKEGDKIPEATLKEKTSEGMRDVTTADGTSYAID